MEWAPAGCLEDLGTRQERQAVGFKQRTAMVCFIVKEHCPLQESGMAAKEPLRGSPDSCGRGTAKEEPR